MLTSFLHATTTFSGDFVQAIIPRLYNDWMHSKINAEPCAKIITRALSKEKMQQIALFAERHFRSHAYDYHTDFGRNGRREKFTPQTRVRKYVQLEPHLPAASPHNPRYTEAITEVSIEAASWLLSAVSGSMNANPPSNSKGHPSNLISLGPIYFEPISTRAPHGNRKLLPEGVPGEESSYGKSNSFTLASKSVHSLSFPSESSLDITP